MCLLLLPMPAAATMSLLLTAWRVRAGVAGRGLDMVRVTQVVLFDAPASADGERAPVPRAAALTSQRAQSTCT